MARALKEHLVADGMPKRMLALDGGGTRGIVEIAFLERLEEELQKRSGRGDEFRLSDYFDLIGGTSTGAIVATALALGMRVSEVRDLYLKMGKAVFRRSPFQFWGVRPQFYSRGLGKVLSEVVGERTLESPDLKTGLAIIAKRLDTGSPWVLTNNPNSMYWHAPETDTGTGKQKSAGNSGYKIREIVRASAAAPFYFAPKIINISATELGLFVDGGVSPHNNPALQLFTLAGIRGYGFNWPTDKDKLFLISIGTGWLRPRLSIERAKRLPSALLAVEALKGMTWDCQLEALKILQWIAETKRPWPINSEIGTLSGEILGSELVGRRELLTFQRYDINFDPDWIKERTGLTISALDLLKLSDFVDPRCMHELYELARKVAAVEVQAEDLPENFDIHPSDGTISGKAAI
jgi:uncharacterized protein